MKKVLIITPRFPLPTTGACEQDRIDGILQLKRLGFDMKVVSKVNDFQDRKTILDFGERNNIEIYLVPYKRSRGFHRFLNPFHWDGAAYEYADPEIKEIVSSIASEWKPDLAWFDYTYLWPLYSIFRARKIPIITRSINFEPAHFLQEDGFSFINLVKFFLKFVTELITIHKSDVVFSITPKEKNIYKKLTTNEVINLPLRSMPKLLSKWSPKKQREIINVFFMGSTYNVSHNKRALEFLLRDVFGNIPSEEFNFYIIGSKFPEEFNKYLSENVSYAGYVDDLDGFLNQMDVAIVPSVYGAGMQQKIFEPLARGIPTITSSRGLAGYPYEPNEDLIIATDKESFISALWQMKSLVLRKKFSKNSMLKSKKIFGQDMLDSVVLNAIKKTQI